MKPWIQAGFVGVAEKIADLRNLPLAERKCCVDTWSSDAWDPTPASCLAEGVRCTLLGVVRRTLDPEPQTRFFPMSLALSEPSLQIALLLFFLAITILFFCLTVAMQFFCRTLRGLWTAYDSLDVAIDFDVDTVPSIYSLILTILSPISIAGVSRTELEVLEEELRVRGFGLKDIAMDGNCFYRSVAYHTLGDEEWHPHIRACAIDELRADPFRYMSFFAGDYDMYVSYVDNMAENAVWGSELEAYALSKALERPVRIWQADAGAGKVTSFYHETETKDASDGGGGGSNNNNIIDIAFFDETKHYFAVVPRPADDVDGDVQKKAEAAAEAAAEAEGEEGEGEKPREACGAAAEERACERGKEEDGVEDGAGVRESSFCAMPREGCRASGERACERGKEKEGAEDWGRVRGPSSSAMLSLCGGSRGGGDVSHSVMSLGVL